MLRRLSLLSCSLLLVLFGLIAGCQPAAAATFRVAADGTTTVGYTFDTAGVLSLLIGAVLPLIVGAFTRLTMNGGLKAAILAALAGATAVLTQWLTALQNTTPFHWQAAVLSAIATFLVAVGAHYQIWKPSGLAFKLGAGGPVPTPPAQIATLGAHAELPDPHAGLSDEHAAELAAAVLDPVQPA